MDDREFRSILDRFPVVRSRDYCAASEKGSNSQSARNEKSHSIKNEITDWQDAWSEMDDVEKSDNEDPFWEKLRLAAERKVGPAKAERFCQAFQQVHKKLVYEELSLDAARRFIANEGNGQ